MSRSWPTSWEPADVFSLLEALPLGVCVRAARDGRIAVWNAKAAELLGIPGDRAVGRQAQAVLTDDQLRFLTSADHAADYEQAPSEGEPMAVMATAGPIRWMAIRTSRLEMPAEGAVLLSVFEDVTSRKWTEEVREEQARFLQAVLDALPAPIFYKNRHGVYVGGNQAFAEYLGIPLDEILGKTVHDVAPPHLAKVYHEHDVALMRQGGKQAYESRVVYADGSERDVIFHKSVVDHVGNAFSGLVGIMLDITERKRAEDALARSEARLRRVFESYRDVYYELELETGVIVELTPSAEDHIGYPPEELIGRPVASFYADPGARDQFIKALRERGEVSDYEIALVHRDGSILHCSLNAALVPGEKQSDPARVIGTIRDVSERRRIERERLEMTRRLEQAQRGESLRLMAAGVAHDFNNILLSLLTNAEIAQESLSEDTPGGRALANVIRDGQRAAELAGRMLDYSGGGSFMPETLDMAEVLHEHEGRIAEAAEGGEVLLEATEGLPPVEGSGDQLLQAVLNLVANAAEAYEGAPRTVHVRVGVREVDAVYRASTALEGRVEDGPHVYIDVEDSASGMAGEVRRRALEPFFTTRFHGRGLGLSAALGIITAHRGGLEIHTRPGAGTRVRLLIPCSERRAQRRPLEAPADGPAKWPPSKPVLIADDEESVRAVMATVLEAAGAGVVLAADGQEAVNLVERDPTRFCVAVLDLSMPRLTGDEALLAIRRVAPKLPALITSGFSERDLTDNVLSLRGVGFLQKPYRAKDLVARVRDMLPGASAPGPEHV
ncbi:MAG: PAS domain S-box protein [Armatimonadia bacterium]|nr:PAS domain S-box protein [Armatimonadia bacterium]